MKQQLKNLNKTYAVLAVFAALVFALYGNTLLNDFVHDDIGIIVNNPNVHSIGSIPKAFTTCFFEFVFGGCKETMQYRPMQNLSYILTRQISSLPWVFHLVNLVYFLIGAFLVFVLVRQLTQKFLVSFVTALIFVVHPINSEVVNWIAAVPELSYTLFTLLSVIFYVKYRRGQEADLSAVASAKAEQSRPVFQDKNLLLVFLFYVLGMLSKEPAALLPVLFFVLDLTIFRIHLKQFFRLKANPYGILALLFFTFLIVKTVVLQGFLKSQPFYQFTIGERIYAFFELFANYLLKLVDPYPLLFFYPFGESSRIVSPQFLLFVSVCALFGSAVYFLYRKGMNLHAFFLIWIFVFLFPVLAFLSSLGENIFTERYLFFPSIGFAFIIGSFFAYLLRQQKMAMKTIGALLLLLVIIGSGALITRRNMIFKNNETLFTSTLKQNPDAHALRFDYAVDLGTEKGDFYGAKKEFQEILTRNPHWVYAYKVYHNIADVYTMENNVDQAIEFYKKSIELSPRPQPDAFNSLGVLYAQREDYMRALLSFCKAAAAGQGPAQEGLQANLDRTISLIQSSKEDLEVLEGEFFKKADIEKVRYIKRDCSKDGCSFFFGTRFDQGEIVFPFLIQAVTPSGKILNKLDPRFDPQTGNVQIDISRQYENQSMRFLFPTCDGLYYEALSN